MAKDPVCGMVVPKKTGLKRKFGERTYYFCSESCLRTFETPEKELRDMKRKVTIAISGVLVLAILRAAFFLGLATGVSILTWAPIPQLPWFTWGIWLFIITTPVMIFGSKGFLVGAYNAIKNRTANMDLLIAIGTWTAYLYSVFVIFFPNVLPVKEKEVYFEVAAIIIAFVLFGKYMEEIIKKRSSAAIRKLLDLKPTMAKVLKNGEEIEVPVENVKKDDILIVRPGDKIPVDGIVIDGSSAVDEKMITGESMPVLKEKGDKVIGGTINKQGMFKIRATNVGQDSTLMQIIKMVEEAQLSTVKIQRLVDKVASYFVPMVLLVAVLSFAGWNIIAGNFSLALLSFIAVLIIACPCALGLATPAALLGGVGKGAEYGILIRNGDVLERAEKLQTIVFDKTGTLTKGEAVVTDIIGFGKDKMEILKLAAIAEKGSEHPLGAAIINKAKEEGINIPEAKNYEAVTGLGIKAIYNEKLVSVGNRRFIKEDGIDIKNIEEEIQKLEYEGKTTVIVSYDKKLVGIIAVADTLKEFATEAIQELKKMGREIIMITGDNERTAMAIAKKVGIDKILAQVLPKDKANEVKKLQAEGKVVAFVGDGINDSPALAQADVGIAIGSGSDIAKETGGIILIRDDLRDVVTGIKLSQATMKKIKQNLFWAFIYNTVGLPIAAFGLLNPIIAAAAMALSSLSVVSNSMLLRRLKLRSTYHSSA
ncbi:MAG TPA: heavy metal translocating P-type ATPase [Candidatus Paceibacterota bacterium]|nr:heavy metal translocating P-type ATPase [Candidatus Paceibacterota bacterium]